VRASLLAYLDGVKISIPAIDAYLEELSAALSFTHPLIRRISYDDLRPARPRHADRALDWVLPGVEIPNLDSVMGMNVQVDRVFAMSRATRPHSHWYREAA
jgi:hypothetical protein